jgi:hypothetical protein
MPKTKILVLLLLLTLFLSACSPETASPTAEFSIESIYTAAALTMTAQATLLPATPTALPTASPTPAPSATSAPTLPPLQPVSAPVSGGGGTTACDNSSFISDITIPDGTSFAPGESFTKTWSFQNTGTCTWTTSYTIAFVSGSAMSGSATALSASVSPGGQAEVSVTLVAPSATGTYTGFWKLENAAGTAFGQSVYVQIVVSSSAATITPTFTATATDDGSTSTPTATDEATETPTSGPTTTPTPTVKATSTPKPSTPTSTPTTAPSQTPTAAPTNTEAPTPIPTNTPEASATPSATSES